VLCQDVRSAEYLPVTGSPWVLTSTFPNVPPAVVTVMPFDGSAAAAPFPGVIVTAGPVGDGDAEAEAAAVPLASFPADAADPLAPGRSMMVVVLPVHAVSAAASAPAARAETTLIALMATL
jgi:hypothetical protein